MTITAIHIEGNLIVPDMTADISAGDIKGQNNLDFGFDKSVKLEDEIAFAWGEAKDQWRIYQRRLERLKETDTATSETREYWAVPLLKLLGYEPVYQAKAEIIDSQTFAISHRSNQIIANDDIHPAPPIHIIGSRLSLDKKPPSGNPRLSAHALLQEYLNKTEHLWGIVTNGLCWRLLRDCSLMTRLSYIEFDLEQILNGENFAEFSLFYRLFHRSRLPVTIDDVDSCLLEFYHQEALQQGGRVRDRLRDGVEEALKLLGNGFLQHPANNRLRESLTGIGNRESRIENRESEGMRASRSLQPEINPKNSLNEINTHNSLNETESASLLDETPLEGDKRAGCSYSSVELEVEKLTETKFYRQLLLLIYRLLFLMVAESRNLLLAGEDEEKARIYNEYYSIDRLRAFAQRLLEWERPAHHRREGFQDTWQGLRVTFSLFDESWRGQLLGLSPLNGDLFGSHTLAILDGCAIDNHDLLMAIRHLSLYENKGLLRRVNYSALDVEELGSVYESLLDYTPKVTIFDGIYHFRLVTGSDRKTTGSYYTPPELVGQLIKSALEPVIKDKLRSVSILLTNSKQNNTTQNNSKQNNTTPNNTTPNNTTPNNTTQNNTTPNNTTPNNTTPNNTTPNNTTPNNSKQNNTTPNNTTQNNTTQNNSTQNNTTQNNTTQQSSDDIQQGSETLPLQKDNTRNVSILLTNTQKDSILPSNTTENKAQGNLGRETIALPSLQQLQEKALLSIKVCDPACGSGHFLLAAARRIGKELAKIRTEELSPTPEALRVAIRDVIQNCIYGVDLNPLAVDLCKVALWMEGFCKGFPLNFLDHRIKWGNSLVGVLDISVLNEGIPDNAFTAVTGDNKTSATVLKRRNKQEREQKGQLSVFDQVETGRSEYGQIWRELGNIPENSTDEVKRKQAQYQHSHSAENEGWWRDFSACNLWTSAFFMPLTDQSLQLLPTSKALQRLLSGMENTETGVTVRELVESANQLAREKGFFHWCLEFPEVFSIESSGVRASRSLNPQKTSLNPQINDIQGAGCSHSQDFQDFSLQVSAGFDCVLGNPPWERIKLQEKEFFGGKDESIANARNKAERTKLIKKLAQTNPNLLQQFEDEKHFAEAQSKFIRESGRFPLTAKGDINTYAIFAETVREIINHNGRCGVIVPTGIATDNTTKDFFGDLIKKQSLASLYDFENREKLFSAVDSRMKFSLLVMTNNSIKSTNFAFFLTQVKHLENKQRVFNLAPEDIALINPNTLTCPVFRTRQDADLTKKIYQRIPVLENEITGENPWGISFMSMFHMSNDSHLFIDEKGDNLLPLYEAKMFHHFDHRWASYEEKGVGNRESGVECNDVSLDDKNNPDFFVTPRYWVDKKEVENRLSDKWNKQWLLGFRGITNSTNERTMICSILPKVALGNSAPVIILQQNKANLVACLVANFSSLVFDFVTRQKVGGTNFNFFILKQLPIIPPENYSQEDIEYISSRVLELVYTANDLKPFAEDMGYEGKPFIWDEQRRAILRAELDAKYAKLYGLNRDELRYILDPTDIYGDDFPSETFRVLKNNEMRKYGEYRTQRLVLAAWDMM